ncbi:hypothetical protein EI555_017180 [Monodon monoceros]|uniref:Uncharacterized protein n=1 Tax=Monodon monoceros TaxID=40151 RepID=A0A4U1EWW9_MONMO|nr:hypothetical protein EI555_017180 [Monodon monoceros]
MALRVARSVRAAVCSLRAISAPNAPCPPRPWGPRAGAVRALHTGPVLLSGLTMEENERRRDGVPEKKAEVPRSGKRATGYFWTDEITASALGLKSSGHQKRTFYLLRRDNVAGALELHNLQTSATIEQGILNDAKLRKKRTVDCGVKENPH